LHRCCALHVANTLLLIMRVQAQQEAGASGREAPADSAAAGSAAGGAAAAVHVSSEGGLDDDELAALADDPELDAYLQVNLKTFAAVAVVLSW
jgi:2-hydroxychromene-2-carboxylate isomerase